MSAPTSQETVPPATEAAPAVLVIDPNEEHQVLSTMALGRRGFRVTIAGTAREGLRLALSQPFAVVVLDLKVKDMPALEVLGVLRERIPEVPKVVVVAVGQEQSAVRALASGASGYLVKTARYNELLPSEVEAQIRAARARRSLKEQKKALGASEERFQKAFRASPVAFSIASRADGRFIDMNDAFLRLVERPREELVGHTAEEVQLYVDASAAARARHDVEAKGSIRDVEIVYRTRSGEVRIGVTSMESIEIEGEPCLLTILRDVTEERRAERLRAAVYEISEAASSSLNLPDLLRAIHQTVRSLMPAENFYIALHDPRTDWIEFPYFVDEKEAPPAPYKAGRGLTEYVLRTGQPLLINPESFGAMVAKGTVDVVGVEGVDWLGVPLFLSGRVIGVLAVQSYSLGTRYSEADMQALTTVSAQVAFVIDRKRADEALRRAEARFRTVFTGAPVGIAVADLSGHLHETNAPYQRMLGRSGEELNGMAIDDITHPDDRELTRKVYREITDGARSSFQYEKRYLRPDGSVFWARVSGTVLRSQGSEADMVLAVIEDVTEARQAQTTREADARRFQTLIAKISDGISMVGPDGNVTWQSQSATDMFGYTPEEVIGRSGLEFVHPDDLPLVGAGFADLLMSPGRSLVAEARVRHKDGSYRWAEILGTNLLEDPDLHALVFNYRDITQRNEALEQIRFQASLLNQVRNAVIATDSEFRIVYWNDYATTMFGWRASEARGKPIVGFLLTPESRRAFEGVAATVRETGHWAGERAMARKDGTWFYTSSTVTTLRDPMDSVIGFVGVVSDVTERVRAQQELESRARQEAAIAALGQKALVEPSLSTVLNETVAALAVTLAVDYASVLEITPDAKAFGLRAKVGWDLPLGTRIPNDPMEGLAAYTLTQGAPVILENASTETRFQVPPLFRERNLTSGISVVIPGHDGPFGILSAQSTSPRAFSDDDIDFCTAAANVIASVIERHRIEKVLAENERLASMGQLAAYVAHELNTPLTNISLLAANIARRVKDPEVLQKLESIADQRRKATAIIMDLTEVPRHPALRRMPEDLRSVIAAAVEQAAPYRKPDVALVVEPGDRAAFANVDLVQIRDVIVHLIRNAFQATSRGSVTVRLTSVPDFLFVAVEDTGTGMSPEVLAQIFHPLYGEKDRGTGAPFGLAASRAAVAAHGGKIEAVSELGKGSTFTVILPRFEAH